MRAWIGARLGFLKQLETGPIDALLLLFLPIPAWMSGCLDEGMSEPVSAWMSGWVSGRVGGYLGDALLLLYWHD